MEVALEVAVEVEVGAEGKHTQAQAKTPRSRGNCLESSLGEKAPLLNGHASAVNNRKLCVRVYRAQARAP